MAGEQGGRYMKKTSVLIAICILVITFLYVTVKADSGIFRLDSLSDIYEAVQFDHSKHMSIADSCGSCHHEHGKNNMLCMDCHSLNKSAFKDSVVRSFTACKTCHDASSRDNPGMPGLKTAYHRVCFDCHRGMGNVGLEPAGCAEICHAKKQLKRASE
jgi:predicted CXXCH cytochrome family protein